MRALRSLATRALPQTSDAEVKSRDACGKFMFDADIAFFLESQNLA